ncbi:MAG: Flp family type IVb pilin [Rhodospirillaceae bacterium]|nr:Flp family type IVb pilin [Rhodospirillaceae bacterium]
MKQKVASKINLFKSDESGVSAIEYAVILSLLSGALLIALPPVGTGLASTINVVDVAIGGQSQAKSSPLSATPQASGNCKKSGGSSSSGSKWGWKR